MLVALASLLLAWAGDPGGDEVSCRYGRARVQLDLGGGTASELAFRLTKLARAKGVQRIVVGGADGEQVVWPRKLADGPRLVKAVSAEAMGFARWALAEGAPAVEYDLRHKVEATRYRAVTVRWSADELYLAEGPVAEPYRADPPTADQLKATYGVLLAELVADGDEVVASQELGDAWTPIRFGMLDDALSMLSEAERERIKPLGFVRDPLNTVSADEVHRAAQYVGGRGLVVLYDDGLRADAMNFAGSPEAPTPHFVRVLLHEVGHALVDAPARRGLDDDLLARFARVQGARAGITTYGARAIGESFAESFSLFHADPAVLQRCQPAVYDWFAAGHHLAPATGAR